MAYHAVNSLLLVGLILFTKPVSAIQPDAEQLAFMEGFTAGHYRIIGQLPEGGDTYAGEITISRIGEGDAPTGLKLTRKINGQVIEARGAFEPALGGEATVLRVRFTEKGIAYEQTCLPGSDLDNYARVTCYQYDTKRSPKLPGMEAWFIDSSE
ncbi:hypothetical protein ACKC9G_01345 [Pokkaliibacter sp. CJK22405]|uniref:hypothetical protein n=1 Tax=Pokkaliibacter sp. CJK22405 TaxID=3384615 RepID=UPI003985557D